MNTEQQEMDLIKSIQYKDHIIDLHYNGLYSCLYIGFGFLKSDTLKGIKQLIKGGLKC